MSAPKWTYSASRWTLYRDGIEFATVSDCSRAAIGEQDAAALLAALNGPGREELDDILRDTIKNMGREIEKLRQIIRVANQFLAPFPGSGMHDTERIKRLGWSIIEAAKVLDSASKP